MYVPENSSPPHRAKKSLGQNFLTDRRALDDIAGAIPVSDRYIVEIGPGYGALTEVLLSHHPARLDLVELDRDLIAHLEKRKQEEWTASAEKIRIHHADILHYDPPSEPYDIIANIPYYITSPILFRFLYEVKHPPERMVALIQREVAEKILEVDGRHSSLSLAIAARCSHRQLIRHVSARAFSPAPKVESSVIALTVSTDAPDHALLQLLRRGFSHPRKKLSSNLATDPDGKIRIETLLCDMGFPADARAETLGLDAWREILRHMDIRPITDLLIGGQAASR